MVKMAVGDDMEISDGEDEAAKEEWENCDVCGINFSSENVTIYLYHSKFLFCCCIKQIRHSDIKKGKCSG